MSAILNFFNRTRAIGYPTGKLLIKRADWRGCFGSLASAMGTGMTCRHRSLTGLIQVPAFSSFVKKRSGKSTKKQSIDEKSSFYPAITCAERYLHIRLSEKPGCIFWDNFIARYYELQVAGAGSLSANSLTFCDWQPSMNLRESLSLILLFSVCSLALNVHLYQVGFKRITSTISRWSYGWTANPIKNCIRDGVSWTLARDLFHLVTREWFNNKMLFNLVELTKLGKRCACWE